MVRVTAPLLLPLAGWWWPYGPGRVAVTARALAGGGLPSRVTAPGLGRALQVDPSLPPPADEGPLAPVADALRAAPPAAGLSLEVDAPVCPSDRWGFVTTARVGLAAATAMAVAGWCGGAPASPAGADQRAVCTGRAAGATGPPPAGLGAWLAGRALLFAGGRALVAGEDELGPRLAGAAGDAADAERWQAAARGAGLTGRSERERALWSALRRAGLIAQAPVADGLRLGLVAPEDRGDLEEALEAHGLPTLPLDLEGAAGLLTDDRGGPTG